jgi:hypothetical protein
MGDVTLHIISVFFTAILSINTKVFFWRDKTSAQVQQPLTCAAVTQT